MNTQQIVEMISAANQQITEYLEMKEDTPFSLAGAMVFGINEGQEPRLLDIQTDAYDLLEINPISSIVLAEFTTIALVTTGWASPLGENGEVEGKPSEHPQRKRVRLVLAGSPDGIGSAINFEDGEVITDTGNATGALNDAFMHYLSH